ncbi:hypothetical protein [Hazenella coriacea]|uniref:Uncharacterized protein n=1 Tax=Hazenella coriacea TaxID=1179467 RepID=A0A4R3LA83_9BACL|nr:hypothetical protein [Hazenella coriacea]TCS97031.1 hypothetical protein EDD58_101678 [Hazenella coriacea]
MKNYSFPKSGRAQIPPQIHHSPIEIHDLVCLDDFSVPTVPLYSSLFAHHSGVADRTTKIRVSLEKKDQERYLASFMKKRLLTIWKSKRALVKAAPNLPELIEQLIYRNVYTELQSCMITSYEEDFDAPLIPFTLFSWIQYSKMIAQTLNKHWDMVYWDEIMDYFQHFSQFQSLEELLNGEMSK